MTELQIILTIVPSILMCIVLYMAVKIIRKLHNHIKELKDQLGRDATFNI